MEFYKYLDFAAPTIIIYVSRFVRKLLHTKYESLCLNGYGKINKQIDDTAYNIQYDRKCQ